MTVERSTLDNGLTVLVERMPAVSRVAVSVHYGVGFRSEPPGREGFAHLFEHLMFRGSRNLPRGAFYDHLIPVGGEANGTTHQDYTDYYQVLPSPALEQALFAEADRMRAPVFSAAALADQLAGVVAEIRAATLDRPYGGFPWPLLPPVMYERHANAHDGYGSPDVLTRVTPDDCADFFDRHYAPGNAVLTVTGAVDPDTVRALARRHFGAIPPRPVPATIDLREDPPVVSRTRRAFDPLVSGLAVAIGYRLPDPATAPADHLAAQVVASLLGASPVESSCGFFGPLDARDPDPLVLAARLPAGVGPDELVGAVSARLAALAAAKADTGPAVAAVLAAHLRTQAELVGRCRSLGRFQTLFGDAARVDEVPGALAGVDAPAIARAAAALAAQHPAVLVVEPGPRIPARPAVAAGTRAAPMFARRRTAGELAVAGDPLPPPGPIAAVPVPPPDLAEVIVAGRLRLVVVRDDRAPLVELAARFPYRAPGLLAAELAAGRAGVAVRVAARAAALGGGFAGDWDGHWLDVTGYAPVAGLPAWLELLGDWFAALAAPPAIQVPRQAPDLWRVAADVLWRRLVPPSPDGAGCLAAVGPVGAADVAPGLGRALVRLAPPRAAVPTVGGGGNRAVVPVPGSGRALVSLSVQNPWLRTGEPDWFLAVAAFGGHPRSRLATRSTARGADAYEVVAGYDRMLGEPRVFVRATVPPDRVRDVLADVDAELERLTVEPLTPAEVAAAVTFAVPATLAPFDSPAELANTLRVMVAGGTPADWLIRAPGELLATPAGRVADAGTRLFPTSPALVVVGDVGPDVLTGPSPRREERAAR